ncbi:MAG: carboxypeptidase M32, partial [Shimia sp.]|nr:carboxypeptidase M32 [Shimia sp.]
MKKLEELKSHTAEIVNLNHATALLNWDQQTNMPPGGAPARANQLATLSKLSHQMFVSDEMGELIEAAARDVAQMDPDSDDASLVRVARRDYKQQRKLPSEFVAEFSRVTALAHGTWVKARADDDFEYFRPT